MKRQKEMKASDTKGRDNGRTPQKDRFVTYTLLNTPQEVVLT
jgi:hypothetical protein